MGGSFGGVVAVGRRFRYLRVVVWSVPAAVPSPPDGEETTVHLVPHRSCSCPRACAQSRGKGRLLWGAMRCGAARTARHGADVARGDGHTGRVLAAKNRIWPHVPDFHSSFPLILFSLTAPTFTRPSSHVAATLSPPSLQDAPRSGRLQCAAVSVRTSWRCPPHLNLIEFVLFGVPWATS